MFLKEDIHRFISSAELFLSNIRGLRYTGLKKVNYFVELPVYIFFPQTVHIAFNTMWAHCNVCNGCASRELILLVSILQSINSDGACARRNGGHPSSREQADAGGPAGRVCRP